MKKRNRNILLILSLLVLFGSFHTFFTHERSNFFLFYDYYTIVEGVRIDGRYMSNIMVDFSNMFCISTILFLWYKSAIKSTKKIILPFFIVSLLDIIDYVLFYKQYAVVKLIALIILIIIYNINNKR